MGNRAILCVDDEAVILDSLKEQLKRRLGDDYIYELAESADEAWEIINELCGERLQILVIVADWLMPGVKGDEFLIRVHRRYPHITKVMLTGQAGEGAIERTRQQANLHRCLYKPWQEDELIETIISGLE